jgi:ribosomal protein L17
MSFEIKIEAIRIAKGMVKDCIKANGIKLCCVKASEVRACAEELVKQAPEMIIPTAWGVCKMRWEARQAMEYHREGTWNVLVRGGG